jgi:hypothetical protein
MLNAGATLLNIKQIPGNNNKNLNPDSSTP